MKQQLTILATMILMFSMLSAEIQKCGPRRHFGYEQGERKGEFFQERIKNLKEKGIITEQEEKEVLSAIEDLKTHRKKVWEDDKLTKEEQETLKQKEKAVRDKVKEILMKAEKHFEEEKTPEKKEKYFNERIDRAVKEGRISKKDAEELKKMHKELIKLEQEIWSDGVMTREEQKKLLNKQAEFNKEMRELFEEIREKKTKGKIKFEKGSIDYLLFPPFEDNMSPCDCFYQKI